MPVQFFYSFFKSMLFAGMLLFLGTIAGLAQPRAHQHLHPSHPLSLQNEGSALESPSTASTGTLHIVAVRIEFQPDSNRFTSGNGLFGPGGLAYLESDDITIDPLPHDRAYIEAHLQFTANYFTRVSGNLLDIEYRVLPDTYRLDHQMEHYSPTGETFTNEKLAMLVRDTWTAVEAGGGFDASGLDPANTVFLLFHAGVGRDIELTGTSLDKTPLDIPSLYLDRENLSNLLNEPEFSGFPVNGGAVRVTNTAILPRTLSRRGETVNGDPYLLQLSLNGMLCSMIGSHLGLPDLFNTVNGRSGIGRFGLMDGASIFSYRGLFPPEPSAWEKARLGWITPFEIDPESSGPIPLPAASLRQPVSSVARHSISGEEYFLVENRHRDPGDDGAVLTIRTPDGSDLQQVFFNTDEGFVFQEPGFETMLEAGVVIDVDNFDFSLPGGLDRGPDGTAGTPDDRFLNGGILIWHIDESVINSFGSTQGVNDNPDRRGVDLEEADGAQDIGREDQATGGSRSTGSAFDFWWEGNDASVISLGGDTLRLYKNRFGPDTYPDNDSNSGSPTFFELYGFSGNRPKATFRIRRTTGGSISPVALPADRLPDSRVFTTPQESFRAAYPLSVSVYTAGTDTFLVIPAAQTTWALQLNNPAGEPFDFGTGPPQQPYLGQRLIFADIPDQDGISLQAWRWDGNAWRQDWNTTAEGNRGFISSIDDNVLLPDFTNERYDITDGSPLPEFQEVRQQSVVVDGQTSVLRPGELVVDGTPAGISIDESGLRQYTGALQLTESRTAFYLLEDRSFYLVEPGSPVRVRLLYESPSPEWPAFADFDRDGRLDFLYVDRDSNELKGVNMNGAMLHSFPVGAPPGSRFTGTPLVSDLDGDQSPDLVVTVQDSLSVNLLAYDDRGQIKPGFPLFVGSVAELHYQPVHPVISGKSLFAVSHAGDLKAWRFRNMGSVQWRSRYGNEPFNKVTGRLAGTPAPSEVSSVLVKSETYNWPNPADGETHIRYQASGPGTVEIKIITLSGRVIFDRTYDVLGGPPEEQRISTAGWGSGIYLAQVTAKVAGRESGKLIKIAVVH